MLTWTGGVDTSDINNYYFCWHVSPLTWSRIGSSLSSASCKYKSLVLNFLQWEFAWIDPIGYISLHFWICTNSPMMTPQTKTKVEDLLSVKSFLQQKTNHGICIHSVCREWFQFSLFSSHSIHCLPGPSRKTKWTIEQQNFITHPQKIHHKNLMNIQTLECVTILQIFCAPEVRTGRITEEGYDLQTLYTGQFFCSCIYAVLAC